MEDVENKKLEKVREWTRNLVTCFEKPITVEPSKDIEFFTDFYRSLSEEHKALQAKLLLMQRQARDISPEAEKEVKAMAPALQGLIVMLDEFVKFLTFFRHKIVRGTEYGKIRAFLQAAAEKHGELKEKGEAIIELLNEICPLEPGEEPEGDEEEAEEESEDELVPDKE